MGQGKSGKIQGILKWVFGMKPGRNRSSHTFNPRLPDNKMSYIDSEMSQLFENKAQLQYITGMRYDMYKPTTHETLANMDQLIIRTEINSYQGMDK